MLVTPLVLQVASFLLVGALWGCTNPLIKKGAEDSKETADDSTLGQLSKFRRIAVWLPYLLNQAGSLVFYYTLSKYEVSLTVPICNALSLVFSIVASIWIGETIERPVPTILGAALVMLGVGVCLYSKQQEQADP